MDIIDYLLHEHHRAEFLSTLIMLFGAAEVLTASQFGNITIEDSPDPEFSVAYLTVN